MKKEFFSVAVTGYGGETSVINTFSSIIEAVEFGSRFSHEFKTATLVRPLKRPEPTERKPEGRLSNARDR